MLKAYEQADAKPTKLRIQSIQAIMSSRSFTGDMKEATKEVTDPASSLLKSKFLSSLSNNQVWIEVLLVFYEIFRYLEEAVDRQAHTPLAALRVDGMRRTKAFEEDLNFYLPSEWRASYKPRECVAGYLSHLRRLEDDNPTLLMVYIYHLYMGLLTSGEMLEREWRVVGKAIVDNGGFAIIDFAQQSATRMKQELRSAMDHTADSLDEDTKSELIAESKTVFRMNNELIQSMQRTPPSFLKQLTTMALILGCIALITYIFYYTLAAHTLQTGVSVSE